MFGTLRFNPQSHTPDFIERADGTSFSEMGSYVPPHSACEKCRAKKLRCSGQRSGCDRCKKSGAVCSYSPLDGREGRRRRMNSQKFAANKRSGANGAAGRAKVPSSGANPTDTRPHARTHTPEKAISRANSPSVLTAPSVASAQSSALMTLDETSSNIGSIPRPANDDSMLHGSGLGSDFFCFPDMLRQPFSIGTGSDVSDFEFMDLEVGSETMLADLLPSDDFSAKMSDDFVPRVHPLWTPPPSGKHTAVSSPNGFPLDNEEKHDAHPPHQDNMMSMPPFAFPSALTPSTDGAGALAPVTAASSVHASTPVSNPSACRCTETIVTLLGELEMRLQCNSDGAKLDAILAWQRQARGHCSRMLRCTDCYANLDNMMLLTMVCDKLVALSRKVVSRLSKTTSGIDMPVTPDSQGQGSCQSAKFSLAIGEYEMDHPSEWATIARPMIILEVKSIWSLVTEINMHASTGGRHAQLAMLHNIDSQVAKFLDDLKSPGA